MGITAEITVCLLRERGEESSGLARLSSSPASRRHDLPPCSRTPVASAGIAHHRPSPRLGDAGTAGPLHSRKAAEYGHRGRPCQFAAARRAVLIRLSPFRGAAGPHHYLVSEIFRFRGRNPDKKLEISEPAGPD